ncbi:MAG: NUDIX domain-containing protein [Gloeobacteraceae cyanobacterium ES-bin-144]|nr:NUDIX domain-containing protein [Verrucomicrobiales bacterium]
MISIITNRYNRSTDPTSKLTKTRHFHARRIRPLSYLQDSGESAEQALKRGVFEEMGVHLSEFTYLGSGSNIYPFKGITYTSCDSMFHGTLQDRNTTRRERETLDIVWRKPSEIRHEEMAFDSAWKALQLYLKTVGYDRLDRGLEH